MTAAPSGLREKADAERGQRAQQPSDLRFAGKERVADHHGEEREDQEIVELEPVADDDRHDPLERQRRISRPESAGASRPPRREERVTASSRLLR